MDAKLDPGTLVADRYRLESILGEGGMGVVWAATHVHTRRKVALKVLKRAASEDQRVRLLREARTSCAVRHPHVREVFDVLEGEDGAPMMIMEYLSGESLAARLQREGKLALTEVAALLLPVVSAVGAAHALGIVHRDLKPENIFLDEGPPGTVKVLDFGIAKLTAEEGAAAATADLTASGALLGTPCYMSPEQAFGEKDLDHRTDVWALGLILYRCLSGVLPTQASNVGQVLKNIVARPIRPVAEAAPGVPADVAALVDRMLSRTRKHRPGDLHEVAEVLEHHTDARAPEFGHPATVSPREPEAGEAPRATDEPSVDVAGPVDPLGDTEVRIRRGGAVVADTQPAGPSAPAEVRDVSSSGDERGEAGEARAPAPAAASPSLAPGWPRKAAAGVALGLGAIAAYVLVYPTAKAPTPAPPALAATASVPPTASPLTPTSAPLPAPAREEAADASAPLSPASATGGSPARRVPGTASKPLAPPPPAIPASSASPARPPEAREEDVLRRPE